MKAMQTTGRMALVVGMALAAQVAARGADNEAPTSIEAQLAILAEAGQPGPQHKKLEPLVGRWTFTSKAWMDPEQPPMETRGTIEREWILGGRFLMERMQGTPVDGGPEFEALGLIGYDNAQEKYTYVWMCNGMTCTATALGEADAQGAFTFQTEMFCPVKKRMIHGIDELRFESEDKTVIESYEVEEGKRSKMMEIIAVRQE